VSSHRLVKKDHLVLIAVVYMLVIASSLINIHGYFGTPKIAYCQSNPEPDQFTSGTTGPIVILVFLLDPVE